MGTYVPMDPSDAPTPLGRRILELVAHVPQLTLEALDALAGRGKGHTSQITRGRTDTPRQDTIKPIAAVLGASPGYLLFGEGRPPGAAQVRKAVVAAREELRRREARAGEGGRKARRHAGSAGRA